MNHIPNNFSNSLCAAVVWRLGQFLRSAKIAPGRSVLPARLVVE